MIRQSLLLFLLLTIAFPRLQAQQVIDASDSKYVYDPYNLIEKEEETALYKTLSDLDNQLDAQIQVVIYERLPASIIGISEYELLQKHRVGIASNSQILLMIDSENNEGHLAVRGQLKDYLTTNEKFNVEAQLLTAVLKTAGVVPAVDGTIRELIALKNRKLAEQLTELQANQNEENHKPAYWPILIFLLTVSVIHGIIYLVKANSDKGKQFENIEFYSLSKFSKNQKYVLYAILFVSIIAVYYHVIFYYGDIVMLGFITLVALIPLTNFILFIATGVISVSMKVNDSSENTQFSILEKKVLIDEDVSGFDLFKLNFACLLLTKRLKLEIEDRPMPHDNFRRYYIVMRGENFGREEVSNADMPFIKPMHNVKPDEGYYLHHYVKKTNELLSGFRSYKRNNVVKPMVERGLLNKKYWAVNIFIPVPGVEKLITEIKAQLSKLNDQLTSFNADSSQKVPLNIDYLLFANYESILGDICEVNNSEELYCSTEGIGIFSHLLDREKWGEMEVPEESEY